MEKRELTFGDLMSLASKWIWLIVAVMVVFGALAFCYSEFCITPMYSSTSKCYVKASEEAMQTSSADALIGEQRGIALSQMVVENYIEILDTNNFASEVVYYLDGGTRSGDTYAKLKKLEALGETDRKYNKDIIRKMISYQPIEEKVVFNVSVRGDNPEDVLKVAQCIEIIMMDYIERVSPGSGVISVIDDAFSTGKPINDYTIIFTLAGLVLGAAIAFAVAFIIDSTDTRIKDETTLTELLELPVIGTIPDVGTLEQAEVGYSAKK